MSHMNIAENRRPVMGIVGCFQNGKSTLVNCLLDDKVATTGDGRATTRLPTRFTFGEFQQAFAYEVRTDITTALSFAQYLSNSLDGPYKYDEYRVSLWKPLLQHVDIPLCQDSCRLFLESCV